MLPEAAQVEEALVNVQREYDETRYQSFSEDELLQYAYLTEKNQKEYAEGTTINMQKKLRQDHRSACSFLRYRGN